jgi:tumor protein p53-inducible protein 3
MKAIVVEEPGGPEQLKLAEVSDPTAGDEDLLIRVHASALNRADTNQRRGNYPPQHGASEILGLELAGEVVGVGSAVRDFAPGDRVYGLSGGGGYGELATLHQEMAMPIPDGWDYQFAAAIPEVFFTANTAINTLGALQPGQRALIHSGGSGVGIAAIQIANLLGGEAWITAGSDEKCEKAREIGAARAFNYKTQDFVASVKAASDGEGVHVILDVVGGPYLERNLQSLAVAGRLVEVGLLGGPKTDINLGLLLVKRLQILGTVMRSRPLADRVAITRHYQARLEPALIDGRMHPVIDRVFPLREAAEAHHYMEADQNFGKIILDVIGGT